MNGIDHYDMEIGGTRANGNGEVHHEGDNSFETVLSSQAMSISESVNDYGLQEEYNNIDVIQTLIDTLLCSPNEVWKHIVFTLFLIIMIILFFLLSSPNFFVRECSHKTTQYMKLKPF